MLADENGEPVAVLIYTGEVHNFRELRGELEGRGHHFRTHSDTEVVLRAYLECATGGQAGCRRAASCRPGCSARRGARLRGW
ncbi:hypothetical protein WME99_00115 [Sorangium sp. So ce136]